MYLIDVGCSLAAHLPEVSRGLSTPAGHATMGRRHRAENPGDSVYLSTIDRPATDASPRRRRLASISANVFALGAVSLVTDVSSEMVSAVLPLYLVLGLQLS